MSGGSGGGMPGISHSELLGRKVKRSTSENTFTIRGGGGGGVGVGSAERTTSEPEGRLSLPRTVASARRKPCRCSVEGVAMEGTDVGLWMSGRLERCGAGGGGTVGAAAG
jgi:hypothetical protein